MRVRVLLLGPNFWADKSIKFETKPQEGDLVDLLSRESCNGALYGLKVEQVVHICRRKRRWIFWKTTVMIPHIQVRTQEKVLWNPYYWHLENSQFRFTWDPVNLGGYLEKTGWKIQPARENESIKIAG